MRMAFLRCGRVLDNAGDDAVKAAPRDLHRRGSGRYSASSTWVLTELAMKQAACARACSAAYSSAFGCLSPENVTFGARVAFTTAILPSAFLPSSATASSR